MNHMLTANNEQLYLIIQGHEILLECASPVCRVSDHDYIPIYSKYNPSCTSCYEMGQEKYTNIEKRDSNGDAHSNDVDRFDCQTHQLEVPLQLDQLLLAGTST